MNPEVRLVSIQGVAGTGKTLLTLAGALEQRREYKQIYLARPIVPLSNKDIGYLPGDIKSKLNPYMEPLWDNLKFIQNQYNETDKEFKTITDMVNKEKLLITPLAYIRGRSLSNIFLLLMKHRTLHHTKSKPSLLGRGKYQNRIYRRHSPNRYTLLRLAIQWSLLSDRSGEGSSFVCPHYFRKR